MIENVLPGLDMINLLCRVLFNFRKEHITFVCDIEKMSHQFKVNVVHRNYLRSLWWNDGDLHKDQTQTRMSVHLFGAVSSPGCANFDLKQAPTDVDALFEPDIANLIREALYVNN